MCSQIGLFKASHNKYLAVTLLGSSLLRESYFKYFLGASIHCDSIMTSSEKLILVAAPQVYYFRMKSQAMSIISTSRSSVPSRRALFKYSRAPSIHRVTQLAQHCIVRAPDNKQHRRKTRKVTQRNDPQAVRQTRNMTES